MNQILRCSALLSFSAAVLLVTACGGSTTTSTTILLDSYQQSCVVDADCVAVLIGDLCSCRCDYGAISRSEQARYDDARARISCGGDRVCGPCQSAQATCTASRCAVKMP